MKKFLLTIALLAALCSANPVSDNDEKVTITADIFDKDFKIYSSKHDIINLVLPLNALNMEEDSDDDNNSDNAYYLFFTEVDIDANGEKDYKGLYVLINETAHKVLDNGRDTAARIDDKKTVYIAASNGIYVYDPIKDKAEKYGTLNDNLISIIQEDNDDKTILYVINDKYEMFKVTEEGTKKEKVEGVADAQQFVIDFENNIYFYNKNKEVYVINGHGVTKVVGFKDNAKYLQLLKPAFFFDEYVPLVVDNQVYLVYSNGTTELSDFEIEARPTGYAMEATLIEFFAYNKKIYKYNVLEIILSGMIAEIQNYFDDNIDTVKEVATRSRSSLRSSPTKPKKH